MKSTCFDIKCVSYLLTSPKEEFDRVCEADFKRHQEQQDKLSAVSLQITAESGELTKAAEELLRQSSVLLWSSIEVLLRDLFTVVCNTHPKYFIEFKSKIQDNEKTRKRFDFKINFETLEKYGFNGEKALGSIFLEHNQLQDLESMLVAVNAALASKNAGADKDTLSQIWKLYFRRHLIVHRRGVVDAEHFARLKEDGSIGEKIQISPDTFQISLKAAVALGKAMELQLAKRHAV